ncbi:hypothetical protein E2C01_070505 [Portunus trituberculatus]|uniref:Uncharacterized protein n=1 Tax=Portunus trituberculatus TaxID=210409 RepID=A0A5B7HUB6_PORTR|nr:hypothetical protein [Portunus trituberculatus]
MLGVKCISKAKKDFWCNALHVHASPSFPLPPSFTRCYVVSRYSKTKTVLPIWIFAHLTFLFSQHDAIYPRRL